MTSRNFDLKIAVMWQLLIAIIAGFSACAQVSTERPPKNNVTKLEQPQQDVKISNSDTSLTPVNQDQIIEDIHKILKKENLTEKDYNELKRLFSLKPNLNVRNSDNTSLLVGQMNGNLKVFKMLLDAGAEPNFPSLHIGCEYPLGERCLKPPIYIAFLDHNTEAMRLLIEHGVNPDEGDDPYLQWAVSRDYTDMVKMLIEHKANVNLTVREGQTPLFFASSSRAAKMLLDAGANINQQDENGQTALMYIIGEDRSIMTEGRIEADPIAEKERFAMASFLIKSGADLNVKDKNGKSALQLALENKTIDKRVVKEIKKTDAR